MSGSNTKEKMISIRLSGVEYEGLKAHYRTYGVRNISELARLALQRIVNESAEPQDRFAAKLADVSGFFGILAPDLEIAGAEVVQEVIEQLLEAGATDVSQLDFGFLGGD